MAHFISIERLPPEVSLLIAKRRQQDRWTIAQIQRELKELGYPVNKSTLARHTRRLDTLATAGRRAGMDPVIDELRRCRAALEALGDHFGVPRAGT
jgi:hypothetical protein